jgi:hypothetical protein
MGGHEALKCGIQKTETSAKSCFVVAVVCDRRAFAKVSKNQGCVWKVKDEN